MDDERRHYRRLVEASGPVHPRLLDEVRFRGSRRRRPQQVAPVGAAALTLLVVIGAVALFATGESEPQLVAAPDSTSSATPTSSPETRKEATPMGNTPIPNADVADKRIGADVLDLRAGVEAIGISVEFPGTEDHTVWREFAVIRDRSTIDALVQMALTSPVDQTLAARKGLRPPSLALTFYLRDGSKVKATNDSGALTSRGIAVPRRFWEIVDAKLPQIGKPEADLAGSARMAYMAAMDLARLHGGMTVRFIDMSLGSYDEQAEKLREVGGVRLGQRQRQSSDGLFWLVRIGGSFRTPGDERMEVRNGVMWSIVEADTGRTLESTLAPVPIE